LSSGAQKLILIGLYSKIQLQTNYSISQVNSYWLLDLIFICFSSFFFTILFTTYYYY